MIDTRGFSLKTACARLRDIEAQMRKWQSLAGSATARANAAEERAEIAERDLRNAAIERDRYKRRAEAAEAQIRSLGGKIPA